MIKNITCTECPMGCSVDVEFDGQNIVSIKGNTCPRGKLYAENEVIRPKRVVTSTVKSTDGILVPVKTDRPVPKDKIFEVIEKINKTTCTLPAITGTILVANICEDANLVVAGSVTK